ncbi:hypothetical protein [Streptantibioticus ferralitis]|uniref:Cellulose biosynthesis protein BcsQ n=1 Tax=Streptantibioticus ferralitis TaxID=236510 RepID=A0ABT5Z7B0_9ACTN|nr:hypothetical protein [Streptantibioticus ferralitis]MDF2259698.1 hypothetical protein [Streptantibioticus ferralitis]
MSVISLVSAKSDGVTTSALALALASPRKVLLAECDLAGGTIRMGLRRGELGDEVGLHQLALADREEALARGLDENLVPLDDSGARFLLPGLIDPRQAAALASTWPQLAQLLQAADEQAECDVVIDAGRVLVDSGRVHPVLSPATLLHRSDLVLLVVRSSGPSLKLALPMVQVLAGDLAERGTGADALGLLLIEEPGGFRAHQVSQALGVPVAAALPWDTATASYLATGERKPRMFSRTALQRASRTAADPLREWSTRRRIHQESPRALSPAAVGMVQRLARARQAAR